jgi:hypothetical protein
MEKFRTGEYDVKNLNVIDEASSRLIEVGGLKLRLFGLGGAVAMHKLCKPASMSRVLIKLTRQSITVSSLLIDFGVN